MTQQEFVILSEAKNLCRPGRGAETLRYAPGDIG